MGGMLWQIRDAALLITICSPILVHQLVWALAIDGKTPLASQSLEPRRDIKWPTNSSRSTEHNSHGAPPAGASSSVASAAAAGDGDGNSSRGADSPWPDVRRPVWNLAHMVNSIKELDYRLGKGANAVEVDVTFGKDGDPLYTYHGPPCDCWRHCHQQEDFNDYLRYVREITMDGGGDGIGRNMSLLFLDLKLDHLNHKGKSRAGSELAKSITTHLFPSNLEQQQQQQLNGTTQELISLIISVNHVTDIELIHNFLHQMELDNSTGLMSRIGFDVGMNDDLQLIESMWRRFGGALKLNLWQGDGFTNCFSPFYNLERLSKALVRRDQENGYPRKVYHWTIDLHDRMRESLQMGVDGIMTNHPERLLTILEEPELVHNFRLATRQDNPFKRIPYRYVGSRNGESARYQRSALGRGQLGGSGGATGRLLANLVDILGSWVTWIREIPYLSLPTTSRFLPSSPKQRPRHQKEAADRRSRPEVGVKEDKLAKSVDHSALSSGQMRTNDNNNNDNNKTETVRPDTGGGEGQANMTTIEASTTTTTDADAVTTTPKPYEGPKWYTSLASNLLVSAMKIVLPADSR